jgi:hypothetical protein
VKEVTFEHTKSLDNMEDETDPSTDAVDEGSQEKNEEPDKDEEEKKVPYYKPNNKGSYIHLRVGDSVSLISYQQMLYGSFVFVKLIKELVDNGFNEATLEKCSSFYELH